MKNEYTEHATITTLYEREVDKNRMLMIWVKVLSFIVLFIFCFSFTMFAIGFRSDRFFYSECVSYPKLPIIKPTPTK